MTSIVDSLMAYLSFLNIDTSVHETLLLLILILPFHPDLPIFLPNSIHFYLVLFTPRELLRRKDV